MGSSYLKSLPLFRLLKPKFISQIHMVVIYGKLHDEALIATKDKEVYALSKNTSSLGTSGLKKIDILCEKGIKTFAFSNDYHILILTETGEVFSWDNVSNKSKNKSVDQNLMEATLVTMWHKIVDIACGSSHCLFLTEEGEVYSWGKNNFGQLGNENNTESSIPIPSLIMKKVVCISCNSNSSIVVNDMGEVYSWGLNTTGQLGITNNTHTHNTLNTTGVFTGQLEITNNTHTHNAFSQKAIFGCRPTAMAAGVVNPSNSLTQTPTSYKHPVKVLELANIQIEKVACGYSHTLALTKKGDIYVWGDNFHGELGIGNKLNTFNPIKLNVPEMGRVTDIAALSYSYISAAINKDGRVFVWGECCSKKINTPMITPLSHLNEALVFYDFMCVIDNIPQSLYTEEETVILNCLRQVFDDPSTSDLTIQVEGKSIHVHKAVLKIRCQYFRTRLQEENDKNVIPLDDFSYIVYKAFLNYLYTGDVDIPLENIFEFLELAEKFTESLLKKHCCQIIEQSITVSNAALFYSKAMDYKILELEEFCFNFALKNMTAVTQTENFDKLDLEKMRRFINESSKAGAFKT